MARLGISATTRASLAMYNTRADVDALVAALRKVISSESSRKRATSTPVGARPDPALSFPRAAGESPDVVADEIADVFEMLGDKESRYQQLLDYAEQLPSTFPTLKHLTQRVPGCMSEVYLLSRRSPDDPKRFEFLADADAHIVRGEIAMLQKLFSGQRARDVLDFDVEGFFNRIGLDQILSSQRRNGLAGMVKRIRADASAINAPVK
jgi:cysteine desulfurase / selenocysteine lyase